MILFLLPDTYPNFRMSPKYVSYYCTYYGWLCFITGLVDPDDIWEYSVCNPEAPIQHREIFDFFWEDYSITILNYTAFCWASLSYYRELEN